MLSGCNEKECRIAQIAKKIILILFYVDSNAHGLLEPYLMCYISALTVRQLVQLPFRKPNLLIVGVLPF